MFAVLIRIPNDQGFLRPGMNADVEVHVGSRTNVLAIPNAALRTTRDVASAAQVLGLDPKDVDAVLARADSQARQNPQTAAGQPAGRGATPQAQGGAQSQRAAAGRTAVPAVAATDAPAAAHPAGATDGARMGGMPGAQPEGRTSGSQGPGMQGVSPGGAPGQGGFQRPPLPEGVTEEQWNAIRQKRMNNEPLTAADSQIMARVRAAREAQGGGQGGAQGQPGAAPGGAPGATPGGAPGAPAAGAQDGGSGLPPGVTREQLMAVFQKQRSGGTLTASEQAIMAQMRQRFGGSGMGGESGGQRRRQFGASSNFQYGGSYIVFVLRNGQPAPVHVRTGFTDMDYSEVVSGLTEKDTVLLLPSASLVAQQDEMKSRMARMGGGVPGISSQPAAGRGPSGPPAGGGRDH
jgi:hypothetical protein